MNYNISFKIINKYLYVSKVKKSSVDEKSLNNTNIITADNIIFSIGYIRKNFDIVVNFLNLLVLKFNTKIIVINNTDMNSIYLDIIKTFKNIDKIIFNDDVQINSEIALKLYEFNNVKKFECYEMPTYLIERFDSNKGIKVLTRHKITNNNRFLLDNHIDSFTDIYYKKQLLLTVDMNEEIINDLDNFFSINTKLRVIKITKYSNEAITTIMNLIVKNNRKNLLILLNEKDNDVNEIYTIINYIKKEYKTYIEKNNIVFKMNYSKDYKFKYFFKELNLKIILMVITIILILVLLLMALNSYKLYEDGIKINNQLDDINTIVYSSNEYTIDDNIPDLDYLSRDDFSAIQRKSNYSSAYYTNYSHVIDELIKINPDTVGWLTVNNSKINYPVVQNKENNTYYLNRDFKKYKNTMGWIFMDYRNDPDDLNENTIIYGHNIPVGGIMFGSLKNSQSPSWYKNESNQIITFNTKSGDKQWKIFSSYKINVTEDYLVTTFNSDEEYQAFIDMIKSRSIYDFNTPVTTDDKILTLSTCATTNTRIVVHAVLITK